MFKIALKVGASFSLSIGGKSIVQASHCTYFGYKCKRSVFLEQSIESIASQEPDDVFEVANPAQESIFVFQAPAKSKKLKKNLLKFQSPPPPSEVETTVAIEKEQREGATALTSRRRQRTTRGSSLRINNAHHHFSDTSHRHRSSSFTDQERD